MTCIDSRWVPTGWRGHRDDQLPVSQAQKYNCRGRACIDNIELISNTCASFKNMRVRVRVVAWRKRPCPIFTRNIPLTFSVGIFCHAHISYRGPAIPFSGCRLGVLGFLCSPSSGIWGNMGQFPLRGESNIHHNSVIVSGLNDQVLAIKWVKDNIAVRRSCE